MSAPQLPPDAPATHWIEQAERYLRQGEPLLAHNVVQEGLGRWPADLRLRQLDGLAAARSGDTRRARDLLSRLVAEGAADAETLGMLARTHKDLGLHAPTPELRREHLDAAYAVARQAYDTACGQQDGGGAWYTGINAATLAALRGDLAVARQLARAVRARCEAALAHTRPGDAYWLEATLGEAALLLEERAAAMRHYARARELAGSRFGDLSSTRRQARLLCAHLPGPGDWLDDVLAMPPVIVYGTRLRRWPGGISSVPLERALASWVARVAPVAAYGQASCVPEVLCLEALQQQDVETHVVLPFPLDDLCASGGDLSDADWAQRCRRVVARAQSVTIVSDHQARGSIATYRYARLVAAGMGRLRAQVLSTDLRGLAAGDARPTTTALEASAPDLWEAQQVPTEVVTDPACPVVTSVDERAPDGLGDSLPEGFAHEIRAMLFADVVGYSTLNEDQTPHFVTRFLGAVAALNSRTTSKPEHVETAGDGLYIVFRGVRDAGLYALELKELVAATDWAAFGLPANLRIRIALHCGPVYRGRNPVTGAPIYTGPHTSRTARIEPITPPGQVYASSAFAAIVAASGVGVLDLQYVGRLELAKGYGPMGLYHVGHAQVGDTDVRA